ncbi:Flp pilus assembly complex ATPase component TadA, partial [Candidatus Parcubacteria bacterium]|nr:Flp pilus assembly complex ATPase component TadA [Candidatus Parcubacteria bacterium]
MKLDNGKLIDILLREHYISEEDVSRAKDYIKTHNVLITDYLLSEEIITKDLLGQAVSESLGVVYADLNTHHPSKENILKIPETLAKKFRVVLFAKNDKTITVTTDDPAKEGLESKLQEIFPKKKIKFAYSLAEDIDRVMSTYRKSLETRFSKIIKSQKRVAPDIIDEMIADALLFKASDIHFEPEEKEVVVRFRVDGVLQEAGRIPKEYYENVLNRIKVQARLRLDEHFAAQDGSMRHVKGDVKVDIRVSIVPILEGEKVVMRLLAEYIKGFSLADLGLSPHNQELLEEAARKPFGMILVTGPTGSGKSTTLYSLLKLISRPEVNVTTIEDPVEYRIQGVNQIQVNKQTDLTFAKGLRSIVRQDPDIILVGEIRDEETAEIAVNAALTGHLLLSTFHANDAATTIPRLLDMGVEPFLMASTLELIIAQRLLRKICDHCRYGVKASTSDFKKLPKHISEDISKKITTLYKGKGCTTCGDTGFRGRTAIFEFISIT